MIGIDLARIRRWYNKTYPQYSGVGYKIVVTDGNQTGIDTDHNLDGIDMTFTVKCYNTETNAVVHTVNGVYNRKHYGGWDSYVPVVQNGGTEE